MLTGGSHQMTVKLGHSIQAPGKDRTCQDNPFRLARLEDAIYHKNGVFFFFFTQTGFRWTEQPNQWTFLQWPQGHDWPRSPLVFIFKLPPTSTIKWPVSLLLLRDILFFSGGKQSPDTRMSLTNPRHLWPKALATNVLPPTPPLA